MERPVIWENEERIPSPSEKLIQKSKEMPYVPIGKFVLCVKSNVESMVVGLMLELLDSNQIVIVQWQILTAYRYASGIVFHYWVY